MDITGELAGPWRIQKKLRDSKLQNSKQLFDLDGHELCIMFASLQHPKHVLQMKKVELEIPFLGKL